MENLKIIKNNNTEEIVEKKSKFIANLIKVESEEDAINKIKEIKKNIMMQDIIAMLIE